MNEVEQYQEVLRQLKLASEKAKSVVKIIVDAAESLKYWQSVKIINSEREFPVLKNQGMHYPDIDAQTWPSGEELANALADYRVSRAALQKAWDQIPEAGRVGLVDPGIPKFLQSLL
jgi:hypothetical protein